MGRSGFRRSKQDKQWASIGLMFLIVLYLLTEFPWLFYLLISAAIIALIGFVVFKINQSKFKSYDISYIDKMTPIEFEQYVCSIYKNRGFKDSWCTRGSGDYGADVIVEMGYCRMVVQVKHYKPTHKVGVKALYEVLGGKEYYKAAKTAVVTTSYFTDNALTLAKSAQIESIDRDELIKIVRLQNKGPRN